MFVPRLRSAALGLAAAVTLGGCAYDGYGYGYGGVSMGYSDGYYDPYYDDYGYGYGYGYNAGYYGAPYYGWYNGFYYPGIGIWVYDRHGKRHHWNKDHKRHWEGRRRGDHPHSGGWSGNHGNHPGRGNWSGYNRGPGSGPAAAPGAVASPRIRSQPNVRVPERHSTRQAIRSERSATPTRPPARSWGGRTRSRSD